MTPYDTEDEAVAIANDTVYGLAGQVSSGDDDRALAVALRIRSGTVGANVASTFSLTSPLGGVGQSGLGRRYGEHGFEEYLEVKAIGLPRDRLKRYALARRWKGRCRAAWVSRLGGTGVNEAAFVSEHHCLDAVAQAELGQQAGDV